MPQSYQLVIRSGPTAGDIYPLEKSEIFIGREANNEIVINDQEVSRQHAHIFLRGENYVIEDLGSTNGTSINGQKITGPYVLKPGEMITFGEKINLLFQASGRTADATVASSVRQQPATERPARAQPAPERKPDRPVVPEIPEEKGKFPILLIIVIAVVLLLICFCAVALYFIDANYLWCDVFPFLFGPELCP